MAAPLLGLGLDDRPSLRSAFSVDHALAKDTLQNWNFKVPQGVSHVPVDRRIYYFAIYYKYGVDVLFKLLGFLDQLHRVGGRPHVVG